MWTLSESAFLMAVHGADCAAQTGCESIKHQKCSTTTFKVGSSRTFWKKTLKVSAASPLTKLSRADMPSPNQQIGPAGSKTN